MLVLPVATRVKCRYVGEGLNATGTAREERPTHNNFFERIAIQNYDRTLREARNAINHPER